MEKIKKNLEWYHFILSLNNIPAASFGRNYVLVISKFVKCSFFNIFMAFWFPDRGRFFKVTWIFMVHDFQ